MKVDGTKPQTTAKTPAKATPEQSLKQFIVQMIPQIKTALPQTMTAERMARIAMTAIAKNPKLAECSPQSFMGSLLTSAQLGLECNTPLGQAYLIPFSNHGKMETEFQLGYQGLLDLCYRTKQYRTIQARIVYEGDVFEYSYGINETLTHRPMDMSEKPVYVYAYYELINGAKAFEVMSWDAIMKFAKKYSMAVKKGWSSPWSTDPESMAKKTLLKKVLKYAPKTVEVAEAMAQDSAIITTRTIKDGENVIVDKDILNTSIIDTTNEAAEPEKAEPKEEKKAEKPMKEKSDEEIAKEVDAEFAAQAEMYENREQDGLF